VAGFAAAALAVLVVLALTAPERRAAPRSGAFAAAGRMVSQPAPGAVAGRRGTFALRFTVGGRQHPRLTAVRIHSVLPCPDGSAIADDVAIAPARGAAVPTRGAFAVDSGGVRLRGFFISPDRATGTVTRSVGHCAARVQWTARPAG
jgi:hypothetical protein